MYIHLLRVKALGVLGIFCWQTNKPTGSIFPLNVRSRLFNLPLSLIKRLLVSPSATLWPLRLRHLYRPAARLLRLHLLQGARDQGPHLRGDLRRFPPLVRSGCRQVFSPRRVQHPAGPRPRPVRAAKRKTTFLHRNVPLSCFQFFTCEGFRIHRDRTTKTQTSLFLHANMNL